MMMIVQVQIELVLILDGGIQVVVVETSENGILMVPSSCGVSQLVVVVTVPVTKNSRHLSLFLFAGNNHESSKRFQSPKICQY